MLLPLLSAGCIVANMLGYSTTEPIDVFDAIGLSVFYPGIMEPVVWFGSRPLPIRDGLAITLYIAAGVSKISSRR